MVCVIFSFYTESQYSGNEIGNAVSLPPPVA